MFSGPVPLTPGSGVMLTPSPSSMLNDELRTAEALRTQAHDALGLGSRGAGGDAGRTEKPLAEELTIVQYEQELSASKRMHEVERQSLRSQVRSARQRVPPLCKRWPRRKIGSTMPSANCKQAMLASCASSMRHLLSACMRSKADYPSSQL